MNKYLQIKGTWEGSYKKMMVVHGSWHPISTQPRTVQRALDATTDKCFDTPFYIWNGVARILESNTGAYTGYASLANLIGWQGQSNGSCKLDLIDFRNVSYQGFAHFDVDPDSATPILDGSGNFHYVPFSFWQA